MEKTDNKEKFAVIEIAGVQLKVYEGKEYEVNKLSGNKGDKLSVKEVLMVVDGDDVKIGKPYVEGSSVELEISGYKKGKKIDGFKYKAKARQRRSYGFRPEITQVIVNKIA